MNNLSLEQLEATLSNALSLGYDDAYYNNETKSKQEILEFLTVGDISNEQSMLLNCAYGVGTLMGRNDK